MPEPRWDPQSERSIGRTWERRLGGSGLTDVTQCYNFAIDRLRASNSYARQLDISLFSIQIDEEITMPKAALTLGLIATMTTSLPGIALAKGCIRGAIAGAVAGHYAHHHAVLGAVGGCAAGRYYYKHKAARAVPRASTAH